MHYTCFLISHPVGTLVPSKVSQQFYVTNLTLGDPTLCYCLASYFLDHFNLPRPLVTPWILSASIISVPPQADCKLPPFLTTMTILPAGLVWPLPLQLNVLQTEVTSSAGATGMSRLLLPPSPMSDSQAAWNSHYILLNLFHSPILCNALVKLSRLLNL